MPTVTYALIDVIGIRKLMPGPKAIEALNKFWQMAETWTNGGHDFTCRRADRPDTLTLPSVYVSTFSDTALVHSEPEVVLEDFYRHVLLSLKSRLDRAGRFYCIVSSGDYIPQSTEPALGGIASDRGTRPYWTPVAGSGPAWIDLWRADDAIKKKKEWHGKFTLYAVGSRSTFPGLRVVERHQMFDWQDRPVDLSACEWPSPSAC